MFMELLMAMAVAVPPQGTVDTTVAVAPDGRLEVGNFRGEVTVRTWDRNEVRIEADVDDLDAIWVEGTRSVLTVRTRMHNGPRSVDYRFTVPRGMALRVEGNDLDVDLEGVGGGVEVQTVNGDVRLRGGSGFISIHAVHGEVNVQGATGRMDLSSVNEEIRLRDVQGDIRAETVNGDIDMRNVRSTDAYAGTTNGDVTYDGPISADGRYRLTTHNGDISITVAEDASATIRVATFQGDFEADFPVKLVGSIENKEFTFTMGSGSARVELESFGGSIHVRRPGR
jgi:hypothetical protein